MPREPRIYAENVLYFVTARVNNDRILFHDEEDYAAYLRSLSEYKLLNGFKLFAYALMSKQIYLLIELKNGITISTVMHNLNSRYTKTYNSRYNAKGHLFQGRFKSILVEKDDYLLRLTRYIHMFPKQGDAVKDIKMYPYGSYKTYLDGPSAHFNILEKPDMEKEIREVFQCLGREGTDEELQNAYDGYVSAADKDEMKAMRKLMHRTAFVGSKEFLNEMKIKVEDHIKEEEKTRVVRKSNPVFLLTGSLLILFLSTVAYNFYNNQSALQDTLDMTASSFEVAREDLVKRVHTLQHEITGFEAKENHGLGGFAWELQLIPVRQETAPIRSYKDHLQFKGGKVISARLMERGFSPFEYTISSQTHGRMVWQTVQTNADGTTVRWYGVISGDKMRGVYSEVPVQGKNRDYSFMSVGRLTNGQAG